MTSRSQPDPAPASGLLAGLAALGPYFAIETHHPRSPAREPWQPISALIGSPHALKSRIAVVRASLAAAAERTPEQIEFRVAASVAQLGLSARLISPALGSAVLGFALPADLGQARWVPALGGPFRLSLPQIADASPAAQGKPIDPAREPWHEVLHGPICSLLDMIAAMSVSRRVLEGNVASAINGAATMIMTGQPDLAARTAAMSAALLSSPGLAGSGNGRPGAGFQRRSCCLLYRAAQPAGRSFCGDCILPRTSLPGTTRDNTKPQVEGDDRARGADQG